MQAVKGYVENGQFFPMGKVAQLPGRIKAVLTILDEPAEATGPEKEKVSLEEIDRLIDGARNEEQQARINWLNRLEIALNNSRHEKIPDFPPRAPMRAPHGLTDEEGL